MKSLITIAAALTISSTAFADSWEFNGINGAELYAHDQGAQVHSGVTMSQPEVGSAEINYGLTNQGDFWNRYGDLLDRTTNIQK